MPLVLLHDVDREIIYQYDKLNRLVKEVIARNGNKLTNEYNYDKVSNRISKETEVKGELSAFADVDSQEVQVKEGRTTYTYNILNQLVTESTPEGRIIYTYDTSGSLTRVVAEADKDGKETANYTRGEITDRYAYDACGNLLQKEGDVLRTQDGEKETVADVQIEQLDEPVRVYNLEIEDSHTYFVSADSVLVHNECDIPWSSGEVSHAASEISHGANSVTVSNRSQAEELFLGLFQGLGYKNTTGMTGKEVKDYFGSKEFTYHWDVVKDNLGRIIGHGVNNPDGDMPHLEIHTEIDIIRIFFGG